MLMILFIIIQNIEEIILFYNIFLYNFKNLEFLVYILTFLTFEIITDNCN